MKLFAIAALVAMAAAGRLEHLERSYLPPHSSNGGVSSLSSQGTFGANSRAFGAARAGLQGHNAGSFTGATSNQYLPPGHGPSARNGAAQFAGSLQGFRGQQSFRSQQYSSHQTGVSQQYLAPRSQASSSFSSSSYQQFGFGQQSAAASRQYLAPHAGSHQQPPQQAFDEQSGYHY